MDEFTISEPEWLEWFSLTPQQRWVESGKLWAHYLAVGGSLDPNPIHRALSLIRKSGVRALLMGGQACVFYGAAEFSRDIDLLLLLEEKNLKPFRALLAELQAERIAVPAVLHRRKTCYNQCGGRP